MIVYWLIVVLWVIIIGMTIGVVMQRKKQGYKGLDLFRKHPKAQINPEGMPDNPGENVKPGDRFP